MNRQAIVIGLGQFGMSVARALAERGVEVFAVDIREERVRLASAFSAEAACFDTTDTEALARTSPERRDVCLCAIGDEAREASIICTALLRQLGAPRVIARANDDLHARILGLVGAHHVINPEREFGERFASQIMHQGILAEMVLGGGAVDYRGENTGVLRRS
jgi:trk system potassium uptake protein TrkA